jgi:hypothetical protein
MNERLTRSTSHENGIFAASSVGFPLLETFVLSRKLQVEQTQEAEVAEKEN